MAMMNTVKVKVTKPVSATYYENTPNTKYVTGRRNGPRSRDRLFLETILFLMLLFSAGCASVEQKDKVLAVVDGETITEADMIYALTISHRREDLSSAGTFDLSDYVNRMVEDRIIVHDARDAGMDKLPEVTAALEAFILRESVMKLREEEVLDKIKITDEEARENYEKLLSRGESPQNNFDNVKERLKTSLRKQKEKEKGDECLNKLRTKAKLFIDRELISRYNTSENMAESAGSDEDNRKVSEVNGEALTLSGFKSMKKQRQGRPGKDIVNDWIDRKLIDQEALSRHYEKIPEIRDKIKRYEDQLLKNIFIKNMVIPRIEVNEDILREYYANHAKDFMKPKNYRMQRITVKTGEEAKEILTSLKNGADFSWLAKRISVDNAFQKGGDTGWTAAKNLPVQLQEKIRNMNPGDLTDALKISESAFAVYRLQEVSKDEVEAFENVKDAVYRACFSEKAKDILSRYVSDLKKDVDITVFEKRIRTLEEKLRKQTKD